PIASPAATTAPSIARPTFQWLFMAFPSCSARGKHHTPPCPASGLWSRARPPIVDDVPSAWCEAFMTTRRISLIPAISLAGLILSVPGGPASAQQPGCGKPELRAEGRRSNPGTRNEKESEARSLSVSKWEQTARELHGDAFARWPLARATRIECEHYDDPSLNGRGSCVAIGLPCDRR